MRKAWIAGLICLVGGFVIGCGFTMLILYSQKPGMGFSEMLGFSIGYGWLGLSYGAALGLIVVVVDGICGWGFLDRRLC